MSNSIRALRSVETPSNVSTNTFSVTSKDRAYGATKCHCGNVAYGSLDIHADIPEIVCPHCGSAIPCRLSGLIVPPYKYEVTSTVAFDLQKKMAQAKGED